MKAYEVSTLEAGFGTTHLLRAGNKADAVAIVKALDTASILYVVEVPADTLCDND